MSGIIMVHVEIEILVSVCFLVNLDAKQATVMNEPLIVFRVTFVGAFNLLQPLQPINVFPLHWTQCEKWLISSWVRVSPCYSSLSRISFRNVPPVTQTTVSWLISNQMVQTDWELIWVHFHQDNLPPLPAVSLKSQLINISKPSNQPRTAKISSKCNLFSGFRSLTPWPMLWFDVSCLTSWLRVRLQLMFWVDAI